MRRLSTFLITWRSVPTQLSTKWRRVLMKWTIRKYCPPQSMHARQNSSITGWQSARLLRSPPTQQPQHLPLFSAHLWTLFTALVLSMAMENKIEKIKFIQIQLFIIYCTPSSYNIITNNTYADTEGAAIPIVTPLFSTQSIWLIQKHIPFSEIHWTGNRL